MQLTSYAAEDQDPLGEILAHSFGFPVEDTPRWFSRVGEANIRVWRRDQTVLGGAMIAPMGQFFGGRSVSMTGVLGVGIAPEHRGAGTATGMMTALLRELREGGVALSTLYPATVPLYQRAGYERAGARFKIALSPADLPRDTTGRELRVERLAKVGDEETARVYREHARVRDGSLDRGPYLWARVNSPFKKTVRAHGFYGADGLEGYVVLLNQMSAAGHDTEVTATDMVAVTPRAAARVLAMLSDYRSIAALVQWFGSPYDVFTASLGVRRHAITLLDYWMLRVVDVARALAARGYPVATSATLSLQVRDDVLPENQGAYELSVERGECAVRKVPAGALSLDVRALAMLYTGFMSATQLARAGLATGDDRTLALADAVFAGRTPAMSDMF